MQAHSHYIHKFPFRIVEPYEHTFQTHCKKRWIGMQLYPILCKQFMAYSEQYFLDAIKTGKVKINKKVVQPTYVMKDGDLLTHTTLRQQPPILDLPINIIHEDEKVLIVNKPPSVTVHTGGGYHYNTLISILQNQMGYKNLHIVHRLDRLTSGLIILAKSKAIATNFHQQNSKQTLKKMYYARVSGEITWQQKQVDAPIICLSHKEGIFGVYKTEAKQEQSDVKKKNAEKQEVKQKQQSQKQEQQPEKQQKKSQNQNEKGKKSKQQFRLEKIDKNQIKEQAKQSTTLFKKVWYDKQSDSTLLQCYPITGRTHQIRVHLQYLGHPILNDIGYGGRFVGNKIIKQMKNQQKQFKKEQQNNQLSVSKKKIKLSNGFQEKVKFPFQRWDIKQKPWEIYLHSAKYKFMGVQYKTPIPYWTQP